MRCISGRETIRIIGSDEQVGICYPRLRSNSTNMEISTTPPGTYHICELYLPDLLRGFVHHNGKESLVP